MIFINLNTTRYLLNFIVFFLFIFVCCIIYRPSLCSRFSRAPHFWWYRKLLLTFIDEHRKRIANDNAEKSSQFVKNTAASVMRRMANALCWCIYRSGHSVIHVHLPDRIILLRVFSFKRTIDTDKWFESTPRNERSVCVYVCVRLCHLLFYLNVFR